MRNTLIAMSCLAVVAAAACTSSSPRRIVTGAAGTNGAAGAAGAGNTSGAAGAAGDTSGAAGTVVDAGVDLGAAGSAAGSTGAAGMDAGIDTAGAAGATGTAGTTGAAGSGAGNAAACMDTGGMWSFTPSNTCATTNPSCGFCAAMANLCSPSNAIDGDPSTRYTDGQTQNGTENIVVNFGATVTITGITLDDTASPTDFPVMYSAQYSTDGTTFMAFNPPVTGAGAVMTAITFPATQMRAIKINQTGMQPTGVTSWWSIDEISVQGCTSP